MKAWINGESQREAHNVSVRLGASQGCVHITIESLAVGIAILGEEPGDRRGITLTISDLIRLIDERTADL